MKRDGGGQHRRDSGAMDGEAWTFAEVQARLVEAMQFWWRTPDREAAWLRVRAFWPEFRRHNHFGDYADTEASPRPLPLSRAQIARRDQATEWLLLVPERDRLLVALAIWSLARGKSQIPWRTLLPQMGLKLGADGLRKRYGRAVTAICVQLSAGAERQTNGQGPIFAVM